MTSQTEKLVKEALDASNASTTPAITPRSSAADALRAASKLAAAALDPEPTVEDVLGIL